MLLPACRVSQNVIDLDSILYVYVKINIIQVYVLSLVPLLNGVPFEYREGITVLLSKIDTALAR